MATTDVVYDRVKDLIAALDRARLTSLATTLDHRLNRVAWASSADMLDDLRELLGNEVSERADLPQEILSRITSLLSHIDAVA